MNSAPFDDLTWPPARLGEALEALATSSGFPVAGVPIEAPPSAVALESGERFDRWVEIAGQWLGLEAEPVESAYAEIKGLLRRAGPALVRIPGKAEPRFLALAGSKAGQLILATPEHSLVAYDAELVRTAVCQAVEAPVADEVEHLLTAAAIDQRRRPRVRAALLNELLAGARVGGCWLLRSAPGSSWWDQAREARLPGLLTGLIAARFVENALMVGSWSLLGSLALGGHLEPAWLMAWLLLVVGTIPCRLLATSLGGNFAIRSGGVLKRRLLSGALKLEPDAVRSLGAGQLLGRVIESEVVEGMAISSGLLGITAIIEIIMAAAVLGMGAAPILQLLLLAGWLLVTVTICVRFYRRCRHWTAQRSAMTNDLVESMIGHRTRLAQQAPENWHDGEDQALADYLTASNTMDRSAVAIQALVPRGWFIVGFLGLAPAFLAGNHSTAALAISVGGLVLAYRAFGSLAAGLSQMGSAFIAWERVKMLWHAAGIPAQLGHPKYAVSAQGETAAGRAELPLLEGRGLAFRYQNRPTPTLQGVDVRIHAGDRILLEGPSGGGKSTLAALLAGARPLEAGLLLFEGLDRQTLGADGWRRRIVIVPQFHENHVLMGTLAFNLLMGRRWPPEAGDEEQAEAICRALDLGPLLDRMPGGLQQLVGETGWQLSQGEKSRIFMARALLQRADIVIFDESFGALDPQTLRTSLALVLKTVKTVVVIAHP